MHSAGEEILFLASKPDHSSKYFVLGSIPNDPKEVRLLTTKGFSRASILNNDYETLYSEGSLHRSYVQEEDGKAVSIRSLWEPTRHGDTSHQLAMMLHYSFAIIGKLHVGHVVHLISLVKSIIEAEEDQENLSGIDILYKSTEWKVFVLHCWIEQAADGIKDRRSILWHRCLLCCDRKLQGMLSELQTLGREGVFEVVHQAYLGNFEDSHKFMKRKKMAVYESGNKYTCLIPFSNSRGFSQSKKVFYSIVLGYQPPSSILPKNIEMARALSKGSPPPLTTSSKLWLFFDILPPSDSGSLVTLNYCKPHSTGREFAVVSASSINELDDMSAGEILSRDMWVTALTLDIDGKTIDAMTHGPCNVYKPELVVQDLIGATREVMMDELDGRWDIYKHRPAVHVWQASGEDNKKLSMRISLHLPENVVFTSLEALRGFVKNLVAQVKLARCRYLTVAYIILNNSIRFEMSLLCNNEWYAIENNQLIGLEDYVIQATGKGGKVHIQCKLTSYTICKSFSCGYAIFNEGNQKVNQVFDLSSWLSCTVRKEANIETFIDDGIYFHNHSLRLPGQSKLEGTDLVRKFCPCTNGSLPVDALMHYPHTDTPSVHGPPILIETHSTTYSSNTLIDNTHEDKDIEFAREFIANKYGSNVTKVTRGTKLIYMDVDRNETCLVKGGTHSSAKMYVVYDRQTRKLLANCWSSKCRDILRSKGSPTGLFLCDLSRRGSVSIGHHDTASDI
jgi:hypothetical protein